MRITNKIMQNNSLYNINNNKVLQDKLSTQMSTQKKLTRPSDDPVVAIRALRLRSSVTELTQYYKKNAPDAESWLEVTEKALGTGVEVLTNLTKQANKGANKDLGVEDLTIITAQMKALRDEFYATGNVDYAGRYVFSGYRTDTTLTFTEEDAAKNPNYNITEKVTLAGLDTVNFTNTQTVDGLTKSNYDQTTYDTVTEQDIKNGTIHRLRLSYDKLDENTTISFGKQKTPATTTGDATNGYREDLDAMTYPVSANIQTVTSVKDAYEQIRQANEGKREAIVFIPETGEVLFSDAAYDKMNANIGAGEEFSVNYSKKEWDKGDLRPEHYFRSLENKSTTDAAGTTTVSATKYNFDADVNDQIIEYDVGYNQKIRVNTTASEAFSHGLNRDIDDLERALSSLTKISATLEDLKSLKKGMSETDQDYEKVTKQLDAAQKAYDYERENVHSIFEKSMTSVKGYLDEANISVTDNGTRSSRLKLISNRLMEQKTTFETLQSENEDADISEVAIQLTSSELTYEAALMATGKIMQTSLMNYI